MFFEDDFGLLISNVVPIALTSIVCGGNESFLSECTFTEYDGHSCTHKNDIIIECGGKWDKVQNVLNDHSAIHAVCNETDVR